jgi:hypothetical protein
MSHVEPPRAVPRAETGIHWSLDAGDTVAPPTVASGRNTPAPSPPTSADTSTSYVGGSSSVPASSWKGHGPERPGGLGREATILVPSMATTASASPGADPPISRTEPRTCARTSPDRDSTQWTDARARSLTALGRLDAQARLTHTQPRHATSYRWPRTRFRSGWRPRQDSTYDPLIRGLGSLVPLICGDARRRGSECPAGC